MKRLNQRLWQIPIFLLVLVSLACNMTFPGLPFGEGGTPTPIPQPLPPTIVETVPQIGSELPLQSPLIVYFSEPMDKGSVESALTADFTGGFLFNWLDDATLSLTPKSALPADGQVNFTLATSAKAVNGLALLEPQSFSYRVAGPLRVVQVLPAAQAQDVSPDSAVVVAFNQPVVALGGNSTGLPAGLSIEPAAPGKGEWLNTSTYAFYADPVLTGGTDYIVRVNPQLVSIGGAGLDTNGQNNAWAFRTSFPELQDVMPKDTDGALPLDSELQLTFNQPMERASVEANFAFSGSGGKVPGTFGWNDKSTVLTFKPAALLERATQYVLSLGGQSRSRGGVTLGRDTSMTYESVLPFGAWYGSFASGQVRSKDVTITFTAPLARYKLSELESLINIIPEAPYSGFHVSGTSVTVNGLFDPGVTYNVTFSGKLKDRWGQALGKDYVFTFREPDATPSVTLAGQYLPVLFTRSDQPFVDVQAVNVSQLQIAVGTFSLDDFFRYQTDFDYRKSYSPGDLDNWNQNLGSSRNQNKPYPVRLVRNDEPLSPGLYYVDISSNEITDSSVTPTSVLVSNLNVTFKKSAAEGLVWAVDLRTQTAGADLPIIFYDANGNELARGVTDTNGLWQGRLPEATPEKGALYAMLARPGDDLFGMATSNWNQQVSPWDFGLPVGAESPQTQIYLYTERPVYRPGDTVHYRGVVREAYDGRYTDMGIDPLVTSLNGPNGKFTDATLEISPYGTFSGEFDLSPSSIPGQYSVTVESDDFIPGGAVFFQVADYRKPEINLSAALSPAPALSGQKLTGRVNAEYFFGAPVQDLPFEWRLYSGPSYFQLPQFQTGLYNTSWYSAGSGGFGETIAEGNARTNADGTFNIQLDALEVDNVTELTLEITASESGGFPVSARSSISMHPANFYAGIRPQTWFGKAGTELGFDVLTVDLEKKALGGKTLTASFQKVTWERSDLAYDYNFTPVYTSLASKQITSAADGKAQVAFTPAEAGTYMLEVFGEGAKSQVLVWVGGTQNAAWPNLPYQHVELVADKDKYKPAENASVFIPNPFGVAAPALITTERSSILSAHLVSIPAEGYTYFLPLSDDHAPNTYVAVTMLGPDTDFRQGYVNLPVEPSAFVLNVDLKATPEKAGPGDQLTLDLKVTDSKGQPVQAEFSMAVVDLAALALANPNSSEIVPTYYDKQPLGVQTGITAAVYARRFFPFVGGKGGGGGGDGGLVIREKFPDTAYWKADIVTDVQGKAQVTLTLPDSLTTWQVDSIGLTQDTRVGQARVQMQTSKELLIRPQTPRFLVVGDIAELAAIVNNNTNQAIEASVSLQAGGFSLEDPATAEQKVKIPANDRARVAWSGLVQAGDSVEAVFTVKAGALQDASRPTDGAIPVLRYSAPQTFSTAGVLSDAATRQEILAVPRTFQPLGGRLDLELSPSLASVILSAIEADEFLPEELTWSNELIVSDFLPDLVTYQTLKDAGLPNAALAEKLTGSIADGVRRLLASQTYTDGGWGWTSSPTSKSDPYLTAYILFALNTADKTGLGINVKDALQRGHDYLLTAPPFDGNDQNDFTQPWVLNRAAFMNYVLQQTGGANTNYLNTVYENRDRLDPWAKALLAETLLSISPTDARATDILSNLQSGAIRSASGAHWESALDGGHNPGTPLFSTAVVVYSLAQRDAASPLLADAVRYLASQRGATGRWASSYETTWIVLALNQTMRATGELQGSFNFSAALNGAPLAHGEASAAQNTAAVTANAPLTQMYLSGANSLLISREAGTGRLYYRAALTVDRPVETAPALEQGMAVSREFLSCKEKDCRPVTSYQMLPDTSGRVKVQLTLTLPHDAYYLMVQDHIPAGAEILDSSLKTSQQGQQSESVQAQYDNADPFGEGWGWWYFNTPQIYTDHILWSADYLPAGTYVLSYTIVPSLAGQYRVLPAHAWQAYFPEVQGTSAGAMFEIKP